MNIATSRLPSAARANEVPAGKDALSPDGASGTNNAFSSLLASLLTVVAPVVNNPIATTPSPDGITSTSSGVNTTSNTNGAVDPTLIAAGTTNTTAQTNSSNGLLTSTTQTATANVLTTSQTPSATTNLLTTGQTNPATTGQATATTTTGTTSLDPVANQVAARTQLIDQAVATQASNQTVSTATTTLEPTTTATVTERSNIADAIAKSATSKTSETVIASTDRRSQVVNEEIRFNGQAPTITTSQVSTKASDATANDTKSVSTPGSTPTKQQSGNTTPTNPPAVNNRPTPPIQTPDLNVPIGALPLFSTAASAANSLNTTTAVDAINATSVANQANATALTTANANSIPAVFQGTPPVNTTPNPVVNPLTTGVANQVPTTTPVEIKPTPIQTSQTVQTNPVATTLATANQPVTTTNFVDGGRTIQQPTLVPAMLQATSPGASLVDNNAVPFFTPTGLDRPTDAINSLSSLNINTNPGQAFGGQPNRYEFTATGIKPSDLQQPDSQGNYNVAPNSFNQIMNDFNRPVGITQDTRESVLNQVTSAVKERMEITQGKGGTEIQVRLDPPELGTIDIRVHTDKSGVLRAEISAADPAVRHLLQSSMNELKQQMSQSGLSFASLDMSGRGGSQRNQPDEQLSELQRRAPSRQYLPTLKEPRATPQSRGGLLDVTV